MSTPFSIIIATYNRSAILRETLESVLLFNEDLLKVAGSEILVIDNNSSDDTPLIVEGFIKRFPFIKYFQELNQGLSHGRNRGIIEAKNEYLIFADDDIEVDTGWLTGLINPLIDNSQVGVVGSRVLPFGQPAPAWVPLKYFWLIGITTLGDEETFVDHAMGASMSFRKSIFSKVGYFDTALGRSGNKLFGGEEVDMQRRIQNLGYKIFYNPTSVVYHKISSKINESYILNFAYSDGFSSKKIDIKSTKVKYFLKSIYGLFYIVILLPFKSIYSRSIEIDIRKRYFQGYLSRS